MLTLQALFAPAQPPLGQPFGPSSQFRKGFAYFRCFQRFLPVSAQQNGSTIRWFHKLLLQFGHMHQIKETEVV